MRRTRKFGNVSVENELRHKNQMSGGKKDSFSKFPFCTSRVSVHWSLRLSLTYVGWLISVCLSFVHVEIKVKMIEKEGP